MKRSRARVFTAQPLVATVEKDPVTWGEGRSAHLAISGVQAHSEVQPVKLPKVRSDGVKGAWPYETIPAKEHPLGVYSYGGFEAFLARTNRFKSVAQAYAKRPQVSANR